MPLHTTDALVLRTYKLNDADRIVVFLTADRGKKRGVAKSARRPRSRFRGALEPLTRASVAYFEKESRELVIAELRRPRAVAAGRLPSARPSATRLLRRADRRVGARERPEREAVPARGARWSRRWPTTSRSSAGALLRVLAAAAAGRLPVGRRLPALRTASHGRRAPGCRRAARTLRVPALRAARRGEPAVAGGAGVPARARRRVAPQQTEAVPLPAGGRARTGRVHRALIALASREGTAIRARAARDAAAAADRDHRSRDLSGPHLQAVATTGPRRAA